MELRRRDLAAVSGSKINIVPLEATENGTYYAEANSAFNPVTVNVQSGGGGSVREGVRFLDYDGTVLYAYTKAQFLALTALPANPTHTGLVSQGWNWSLADAQDYVTDYGALDIGQMYITDDGATRLYVKMEEGRLSPMLRFYLNGTATVDWGDGTTADTQTTTSNTLVTLSHTYASAGDYVVSILPASGASIGFYGTSGNSYIFSKDTNVGNASLTYLNCIQRIELGSCNMMNYAFQNCYSLASITIPSGVTSIGTYLFNGCYSLASITIPSGVTSIGNNMFTNCYSLASITIPSGVTSTGNSMFQNCFSLASITIPSGVTSIGQYAFQNCRSLASITIPSGVTSIGQYSFQNCYGLGLIKFESSTPPTVANMNAWSAVPTDCIIYVPSGSLSAYTSAANYPSSSTYTYVEY